MSGAWAELNCFFRYVLPLPAPRPVVGIRSATASGQTRDPTGIPAPVHDLRLPSAATMYARPPRVCSILLRRSRSRLGRKPDGRMPACRPRPTGSLLDAYDFLRARRALPPPVSVPVAPASCPFVLRRLPKHPHADVTGTQRPTHDLCGICTSDC